MKVRKLQRAAGKSVSIAMHVMPKDGLRIPKVTSIPGGGLLALLGSSLPQRGANKKAEQVRSKVFCRPRVRATNTA